MKRLVGLIILLAVIYFGHKGVKKFLHAKRLKIGVDSFKLPKLNLASLFTEVNAIVKISITNFSKSLFEIEQIKVDVYSTSGKLIAEQIQPLKQTHHIQADQKNILPLSFLISPTKFKELIKQAGGVVNVGANFLTSGNYGIPIELRGFVVAEGVSIEINEKLIV